MVSLVTDIITANVTIIRKFHTQFCKKHWPDRRRRLKTVQGTCRTGISAEMTTNLVEKSEFNARDIRLARAQAVLKWRQQQRLGNADYVNTK